MVSSTSSTTSNNAATGSSIISALGTGSGIDSNKLADDLTAANKVVQEQRLTSKKTLLETQISDYGLLRSSLSKLETSAAALGSADTFNAKALSVPDTKLLAITKLDAKATAGTYQLKVEQIAQAQSISSGTFSSVNDPVGTGTLTIRLGDWNSGSFTVDSTKTGGGTITIDESNNSLTGLRDAINKANIGVSASIVSDGGSFKLLMTAKTGANNEIEITAAEGSVPGLAKFNFNQTTPNTFLTQQQEGLDAKLTINGLSVKRESNHVTDVIDGLEFDLFASSTTETINVTISEDKATAEQTIRDFVAAYNTFKTEMEKLVGFDSELDDFGSLHRDPLAKNLMQSLRNTLTSSVPGITGAFSTLGELGIRTKTDGSLEIIEDAKEANTNFRAVMDNNFEAVRDFFVPKTSSSTSDITVTKFSANSKPGTYEVLITQQPVKGHLEGASIIPAAFPFDTGAEDYSFAVKLDGNQSATITLPANKTYADGAAFAADIQSLINLDATIKAARATVNVSFDGDKFTFGSDSYGASSNVEFTAASTAMADVGIAIGVGTAGKDVAGTIDGVAAFGYGNVLLPGIGSKAEGLSLLVQPGATSSSINFTRGFAGSLTSLVNDFLKTSGLIKERETVITKDIARVATDTETLNRRSDAFRARLMAQFQAMESIVRSLNSTGNFLDGIVDRLPFTSKN